MPHQQCQLLGGIFPVFIQACLGTVCIGTLVIKRQNEVPRREWYVWFLDVMKQGIGSSFGHFSNIYLSMLIAENITGADQCQWYCLTYIIDSVIGTSINLMFLHCFESTINKLECFSLKMGDYGDPPSIKIWIPQLIIWLTIVLITKMIILFTLFQLLHPLDTMIRYCFQIFSNQPQLELVMVMIIIPTILNTIQFWVTDTFLKRKTPQREESQESGLNELDEEFLSDNNNNNSDYPKQNKSLIYRNGNMSNSGSFNSRYSKLGSNMNNNSKSISDDGDENDISNAFYNRSLLSNSFLHRTYVNSGLPYIISRAFGTSVRPPSIPSSNSLSNQFHNIKRKENVNGKTNSPTYTKANTSQNGVSMNPMTSNVQNIIKNNSNANNFIVYDEDDDDMEEDVYL
eukprot:gene9859-13262_t